jgi:hypothetical protein
MSYANKLSSFEHSFLLRATTAHALRVTIPNVRLKNRDGAQRNRRSIDCTCDCLFAGAAKRRLSGILS